MSAASGLLTAPHLKVPRQLNRAHCTPQPARAGLAESAARCAEMLAEALGGCEDEGRVEKFLRDGWARPWPVGLEMLCYMVSHEAHHRGQVCMLAHQLGFPLANEVASGSGIGKNCGKSAGRLAAPATNLKESAKLIGRFNSSSSNNSSRCKPGVFGCCVCFPPISNLNPDFGWPSRKLRRAGKNLRTVLAYKQFAPSQIY